MSDDTRTALGIPSIVQTNLGPVEVRALSARDLIVSIQKLMTIAFSCKREMDKNKELGWYAAVLIVFQLYPEQVLAALEPTTNLEDGKLGDVNMGGLFLIIAQAVELNEEAIENFFVARAAVEKVMGRLSARIPRLPISSTSSSGPGGVSQMSNGSHSHSSPSSEEKPPSEGSPIASSG